MSQDDFNYFESGADGWASISNTIIPNPNGVPIKAPLKSTMVVTDLADGSQSTVTPETKYRLEPVGFTWNFQSGVVLYDKLMEIARNNTPFKIQGHMPGMEWTGRITNVDPSFVLWGRNDYRNISIVLKPTND